MFRFIRASLAVVLVAAAVAGVYLYAELNRPYGDFPEPLVFEYVRGAPGKQTAAALEELGIVRSRWLFLAARALRPGILLMAGEYRFSAADSPVGILSRFAAGDVLLRQLTIPEGLTRFEVSSLVAEAGYAGEDEFLELTADPTPIQDLVPEAKSLEGFLFPETYSLARTATGEQLLAAMLANFRQAFEAASQGVETDLSLYETLTLASLIEKESGVPSERPLISAVFHNRLRRSMRLQCDPTIIYGLLVEDRYRGAIHASDIEDPHPYNTYVHAGLPPGPIANPGAESLRAALSPADSDYIFFVANTGGAGDHSFSSTLREHNQAVVRLRASRNTP
ncbi:MAG: endolytic transglycosylase MltG [Acidobacteria bacterium]|nr:endolytic transglycosylase MltG [Acidobacteriota bacterium]MDA1236964.1 endolytic transglycosylase MltG [Acidobacteriota bacterium]